jgi:hypothetical protein
MTSAELQVAVLQELGVLATGESALAADGAIVTDHYGSLYEMLLTEGLVSWAAADNIPDFAERPVTLMVAYLCCGKFGVSAQKVAELKRVGALSLAPVEGGPSEAERQLRRQLARGFVYSPIQTEFM